MPLRAYEPLQSPCRICGTGFEIMQSPSEAPLEACPKCGAAVRARIDVGVNSPRVARKPSVSEARQAGFTVLKRVGDGEYEKQ